jgi:antitoxin component YwqK of YwqJK toxin-antitoxin module
MGYSKKTSMTKYLIGISILLFASLSFGQEVLKENLTKMKSTYWDFNKSQIQSRGKNYIDELGETTDKHGKWTYYDRLGEVEEVRHYYRDMLHGKVTLLYPNGKKRQEGFFKINRQDSIYVEWFETGKVKVEGTYKMNQRIDRWKNYYVDGRLKSVEEAKGEDTYIWEFYLPDSLHTATIVEGKGELITYYSTGQVKEWYNYVDGLKNGSFEEISVYGYLTLKGEFKNGEKHGSWEYFYYTGDKEKTSTYKEGVLDGRYQYFYDNGQLNVNGRYKNGEKDGLWTWYTNKGTRDMEGSFDQDEQDASWTYWYPTGEISYYANYDQGKKTGTWTYLYLNGEKFKQGTFVNDLRDGAWKTWYEDGTLLLEGSFFEGKENGEWLNYWDNGSLKNKTVFRSGALDGNWESHTPTGKKKLVGEYEDDMRVGEWLEYFDNGKTKEISNYKLFKKKTEMDYSILRGHTVMESKLHGASTSFSQKDYKLTEQGEYKRGEKDGEWVAYHPGGRMAAVISEYKEGELHGTMKIFNNRGKVLQEMGYKDGLKHGKFTIYDKRGKVINELRYSEGMRIIEGSAGGGGSFTPGG